jgi:hypothetical protein
MAVCQKQADGSPDFLVPPTWKKIAQRNRFFKAIRFVPPVRGLFRYLATRTATAFELPRYAPVAAGPGGLDHTAGAAGNIGHRL